MINMSDISDDFLAFYIDTHPAPQPTIRDLPVSKIKYLGIKCCEFCDEELPK